MADRGCSRDSASSQVLNATTPAEKRERDTKKRVLGQTKKTRHFCANRGQNYPFQPEDVLFLKYRTEEYSTCNLRIAKL